MNRQACQNMLISMQNQLSCYNWIKFACCYLLYFEVFVVT